MLPHASFSQAAEEFDRAWRHPQHTPIELEPSTSMTCCSSITS